jgi:RHS repeat-associated protein
MFETDEGGRVKACYLYRGAALVARVRPQQTTHFYHFDKTGNTLALTEVDGKVFAAYAYSPFGAVVKKTGPADDNPFTYVGKYGVMDEDEGLFFMKNRYYDAHTGRFLQKDPIGFAGGTNLYAYVENNPVTNIDPEGTVGILVPFLFFAAAVLLAAYEAQEHGEKISEPGGTFGVAPQVLNMVEKGKPGDEIKVPGPKEKLEGSFGTYGVVAKGVTEATVEATLGRQLLFPGPDAGIPIGPGPKIGGGAKVFLPPTGHIPGKVGAELLEGALQAKTTAQAISNLCTPPKHPEK